MCTNSPANGGVTLQAGYVPYGSAVTSTSAMLSSTLELYESSTQVISLSGLCNLGDGTSNYVSFVCAGGACNPVAETTACESARNQPSLTMIGTTGLPPNVNEGVVFEDSSALAAGFYRVCLLQNMANPFSPNVFADFSGALQVLPANLPPPSSPPSPPLEPPPSTPPPTLPPPSPPSPPPVSPPRARTWNDLYSAADPNAGLNACLVWGGTAGTASSTAAASSSANTSPPSLPLPPMSPSEPSSGSGAQRSDCLTVGGLLGIFVGTLVLLICLCCCFSYWKKAERRGEMPCLDAMPPSPMPPSPMPRPCHPRPPSPSRAHANLAQPRPCQPLPASLAPTLSLAAATACPSAPHANPPPHACTTPHVRLSPHLSSTSGQGPITLKAQFDAMWVVPKPVSVPTHFSTQARVRSFARQHAISICALMCAFIFVAVGVLVLVVVEPLSFDPNLVVSPPPPSPPLPLAPPSPPSAPPP